MFFFPQNSAMKKIQMFASFSMMLLSLAQNVMSKEECYIKTNGCSVPGGLPFFYKTTFTPACVKHDVCYSCVRIQKSVIAYQTTYTTRSHKCFLHVSLFLSRMRIGLIEAAIKTLVVYHLQEVFGKSKNTAYSGHLRHDYLIKYAYFSKCYLERFASISAPEK